MKTKSALITYFASLLLFGSNGVVASSINMSSIGVVFYRSVLGSALLLILFMAGKNRIEFAKYKKDIFFIALSGVAMAADWLFLFEAYDQIGVSLGMLINYTGPAIVIALSPVLFKEKLSAIRVTALFLALVGACLISGRAAAAGVSLWGLFCAAMSAVSYAVMVLANKKATYIDGLGNATVQLCTTAVVVTVFAVLTGNVASVSSSEWIPVLWLGLVNTGLGCWFYFSSIGKLPAQSVAICGYIEPLSAVLLAALILHETLSPIQILGASLIIGGALLGEKKF